MEGIINKLMEERMVYNKMLEEVKKLEGVQKNIQTLFELLLKEKDKTFLYLQRFKIYELFNAILTFANSNKDFFEKNNEIEIKIFFEFLRYFTKRQFVGSLEGFEDYFKNNFKNQSEELLFFIGTPTFYNQIIKTVNRKIDDSIEELLEEILKMEGIKQEIPQSKELHFDEELLEELENNKKQEIVVIYNEIITTLLDNNNQNGTIIEVLYQNNLVEKNEKMYNFFQENESFITSLPNGQKIFELVSHLSSELIYEKTFSQLLQELKISSINLFSFNLT